MSIASAVRAGMRAVPAELREEVEFKHPGTHAIVSRGIAVQDEPDLEAYRTLSMELSRSLTLFYTPDAEQSLPPVGSEVVFAGEKYHVKGKGGANAFSASVFVTR